MQEEYRTREESDLMWEAHEKHHILENELDTKDFSVVNIRMEDFRIAHEKVHDIHSHAHDREHEMTNLAITKAAQSMDVRLESMNEFRDQLTVQSQTFLTREVFEKYTQDFDAKMDLALSSVADKSDTLMRSLVNSHNSDYNSLRDLIQAEREIRKAFEGSINAWKWLAGFLGASGVAGVVFLFATRTPS